MLNRIVSDVLEDERLLARDAVGECPVAANVAEEELIPGAGAEIPAERARVVAVVRKLRRLCARPGRRSGPAVADVKGVRLRG